MIIIVVFLIIFRSNSWRNCWVFSCCISDCDLTYNM